MKRRSVLGSAGLALLAPLAALPGCQANAGARYEGGWVGSDPQRGHRLRDHARGDTSITRGQAPALRRAAVVIVGAGVAGLACARALRRRGIDDVHVLDLEDQAGGNSRGHAIAGMACPLGAHYLPVPGKENPDLIELLAEFGLCHEKAGRWVYDERHLCHSPQERLFMPDPGSVAGGHWFDGLLPRSELLPKAEREATAIDYRRFAAIISRQLASRRFSIPTWQAGWGEQQDALDAISFRGWLDGENLTAPALRWYLDYCCRDDYGASLDRVSAWAGLQYFASRHGFHSPDDESAADGAGVLTWPQGNAWLTGRLAQPLGPRLHCGRTVLRVDDGRETVGVDAWDQQGRRLERWTARQVVMATPLFIAARVLDAPSAALQAAAARLSYAPWLVANLHLGEALRDHPGAPPSWDNVAYGSRSLGYVDAMHQNTRSVPGPTVLSAYWALGGSSARQAGVARSGLLQDSWQDWAERVIDEFAAPHPDLRGKLRRVDIARFGHGMCIPAPGTRSDAALQALQRQAGRVSFAHSDLSAYSIFEEAFFHGHRVGSSLKI